MEHQRSNAGSIGIRALLLILIGALGSGALFYDSGIGTEPSNGSPLAPSDNHAGKPVLAMNLALGPMVFLAREMDFSVKNSKSEALEDSRIAARIEVQLHGLRDLYRRESAGNPKLVGNSVLQLTVNDAGQVSQVKELSSRLNDSEFRQTVVAEMSKWTFAEVVTEPITIQVPLLFVQEGMDITTLVRWELSLTGAAERSLATAPAKSDASPSPKAAAPATVSAPMTKKTAAVPEKGATVGFKGNAEEVQIKYATLLRKEPNFNAAILSTFTIGTKVVVISRSGDWLEVRSQHDGPSGYIRKEFVIPVEVAINH